MFSAAEELRLSWLYGCCRSTRANGIWKNNKCNLLYFVLLHICILHFYIFVFVLLVLLCRSTRANGIWKTTSATFCTLYFYIFVLLFIFVFVFLVLLCRSTRANSIWKNNTCNLLYFVQGVPKKIVHSDFFTPWHDNELLQQQGSTSQPIFGIKKKKNRKQVS